VTGRRGRRCRKLLNYFKEWRWYSHLKEDALDRTMWTACFGRGFGPVVRQTTKWMNWVSMDGWEESSNSIGIVCIECKVTNSTLKWSATLPKVKQSNLLNTTQMAVTLENSEVSLKQMQSVRF
jgi:hypothetical protein